ncbi:MAG TPA: DUF3168 domain-containing protein [Alphaproteobacteria bacterium]|nr:DUF3168 domain-containing protein [Alphaproteobacteria bacterium]
MSGEATWALQKAVFDALTGSADLMAMVSGVYDHVPADTAFPYVTIGETTVADWSSKTFDGQEHSLTLHVWSRARGRKETKEIFGLVYAALNGAPLSVAGQQLVDLRFDFAQTLLDTDGLTFHGVQRYRAVTRALS